MKTPGTSKAWSKEKYQLLILLPFEDNDGESLAYEREQVLTELQEITGGFTQFAFVNGIWLDNNTGQIYSDLMQPVYTTFDADNTEVADALRDHIRPWCDLLRQHSLYAVLTPVIDISQASTAALETYDAVTM